MDPARKPGGRGRRELKPLEPLRQFLGRTIWEDDTHLPTWRRTLYVPLRLIVLAYKNAESHGLDLHAASLTYRLLLALAPCLAIVFVVLNAFEALEGVQDDLLNVIIANLAPGFESEVRSTLLGYIEAVRGRTGQLASIAILFVVWSVYRTVTGVEDSFNRIVGGRKRGGFFERFGTYWAVLTLGPALIATAFSLQAILASTAIVTWMQQNLPVLVELVLRLTPVLVTTAAFTLLYVLLPRARVPLKAAVIGGCAAGLTYEAAKRLFASFAGSMLQNQGVIYGSLGALFVFLLWIYTSWLIILLGLEVVVALQTAAKHREDLLAEEISQDVAELIGHRTVCEVCLCFRRGDSPPTVTELIEALGIAYRHLRPVLDALLRDELLREVEGSGPRTGFVPGRHPGRLTPADVVCTLRSHGTAYEHLRDGGAQRVLGSVVAQAELASQAIYERESFDALTAELAGETSEARDEQASSPPRRVEIADGDGHTLLRVRSDTVDLRE